MKNILMKQMFVKNANFIMSVDCAAVQSCLFLAVLLVGPPFFLARNWPHVKDFIM